MPPTVTILRGDSLALLTSDAGFRAPETEEQGFTNAKPFSILKADACVTDPPYGFDFAGDKDWDSFEDGRSCTTAADDAAQFAKFTRDWSRALRMNVLKPGAHVLAFSADRTIDLVGRGLREAGYDIVRLLFWLYASGQVKNPNDTRPGCEPIFVGRMTTDENGRPYKKPLNTIFKDDGRGQMHAQTWKEEDGKHPTNMLISEEAVALDEDLIRMVNESKSSFFVPKPSAKDRDWGCGDLPMQKKDNRLSHMTSNYTGKVVKDVMAQNVHPTVKPIEVMRRLIRLVSRPGHTIIDPFLGSGTTGIAAVLEGRNFIGIEREPDYFDIAKTRVLSALEEVSK
jgi:DNA modification methylase